MAPLMGYGSGTASAFVQVIWSPTALAQLIEIRRYIQRDKPEAARGVATRIVTSVAGLVGHPRLGHAGRQPTTLELVIPGTPYIIVYRAETERLIILTVLHGAQRR